MYEDNFGERLATLRTQKNISAREMSLALGQNESYINRIENKKTFPSMQVFFYICEYLNISPMDFFDTGGREPKEIDILIDNIKGLNPRQLHIITLMVNELIAK